MCFDASIRIHVNARQIARKARIIVASKMVLYFIVHLEPLFYASRGDSPAIQ